MKTIYVSPNSRDLVMVGGSPKVIDGREKLEQDLRIVLIEKFNSNPYTTGWGTNILDLIGESYDPILLQSVVSMEVTNAIQVYQQDQFKTSLNLKNGRSILVK